MRKITFLFLLIIPALVFSQKCKYEVNEFDEFKKHEVKIVKEKQLTKVGMGLGDYVRFDARSMDGNKFLRLFIAGQKAFHVQEGDEVLFLTDDGEVITLNYTESATASAVYQKSVGSSHWSTSVLLYLDEENIEKLLKANIAKVRWYTAGGFSEKEVNPKHKSYVAESLNCII